MYKIYTIDTLKVKNINNIDEKLNTVLDILESLKIRIPDYSIENVKEKEFLKEI